LGTIPELHLDRVLRSGKQTGHLYRYGRDVIALIVGNCFECDTDCATAGDACYTICRFTPIAIFKKKWSNAVNGYPNLIQTHGMVFGVVWWVIGVVLVVLVLWLLLALVIAALYAVWNAGAVALWYAMRYAGIERHEAWNRSDYIVKIGLAVIAILVIFGWIIYQVNSYP
jgi:hypothetical protein